jgi:hypothetical protein
MVCVGPGQLIPPPSKIGVKVTVAVAGLEPLFVAVKDGMFPVPEAFRPIDVVLFAQV